MTETRTQMLIKIISGPAKDPTTGDRDPTPKEPANETKEMASGLMDDETLHSAG